MNRRGFLRGALAAVVGSCVRWLPMPAPPRAQVFRWDMAPYVDDWRFAVRAANSGDLDRGALPPVDSRAFHEGARRL